MSHEMPHTPKEPQPPASFARPADPSVRKWVESLPVDPVIGERLVTCAEAANKLIPGRPDPSVVYRHCRQGVKTRGRRVVLRSFRYGRSVYTSIEALRDFAIELANAIADDEPEPDPPAPPRRRGLSRRRSTDAARRAEEELIAAGA